MTKFLVRYQVNNATYETIVGTDSSQNAINWVLSVFPNAKNISVVKAVDIIS
jgi:hypothetical protein